MTSKLIDSELMTDYIALRIVPVVVKNGDK